MRRFEHSFNVSLAQRYWNFEWDESTNRARYGFLASKSGVGANLHVRLFSEDQRDLQPGQAFVKRLLDHRALFVDEPEFRSNPSTLEAVTRFANLRTRAAIGTITGLELHDGPTCACSIDPNALDRVEVTERIGNLTVVRAEDFDPRTGLGFARNGAVESAVRKIAPRFQDVHHDSREQWARDLRAALASELPELIDLRIDLGELGPLRRNPAIKEIDHVI